MCSYNIYFTFLEARINKLRLYNMSAVGEERRWLQDILLSDSSDSSASGSDTDSQITEEDFQDMLKFHILRKKYQGRFYQKPEVRTMRFNNKRVHKYLIGYYKILLFSEYTVSIL